MSVDFSNEADVIEIVVPGPTQVITLAVPGLQGPPGRLVVGTVTTGAPGTSAAVSAVDNAQGQQVVNFTIPRGDVGVPNSLAIGTVTTGAAGANAAATITGAAPSQTLNLTLPRGATGAAALMSMGTVTTGAAGSVASASITGIAPNYVLNLTIPRGDTGTVNAHTHTSADITDATDAITASTVVRRDAAGRFGANNISIGEAAPTLAQHATRKDYVDSRTRVMPKYVAADYTIISGDDTLQIRTDNATGNIVITAPDLSLPTGFYVDVLRWQNGTFTLVADTGMSFINGAVSTALSLDKYQSVRLIRVSATQWFVQRIDTLGTTAATPDTIVRRSSGADITVGQVYSTTATPSSANSLTRKDYVDGIGTSNATASTIMRRDASGVTQVEKIGIAQTPTGASEATRKDYVDAQVATRAPTSHTHTATNISDSTVTGRSVLTAIDAAAARTAIGAGTGNSNLAIGTTNTTAKAGDYQPTAANISDATVIGRTVLTSVDAAAVRTAIGAGTSNLAIGTTGTTAAAGNDSRLSDARTPLAHTHTAVNISDSTTTGRSVLTAVDAAAARTAIGAGTSSLAIGTTGTTAKAGDYAPPAGSETVVGIVELATAAETTTGTDNTRAVHPAGLKVELDKKVSTTNLVLSNTAPVTPAVGTVWINTTP